MNFENFLSRVKRAGNLEAELYEEVEADTDAMGQAVAVVVISSLAAGISYVGKLGLEGVLLGTVAALLGWVLWAFLTYLIGTKLLPTERTESDMGELLRTIGFSSAPGVLRVFGFFPLLGPLVRLGASLWMLVAMVVAVRQALDYESTGRAVAVCGIGWVVQVVLVSLLYAL